MGMKDAVPYLGMVGVQFIQVGLIVAIKEATSSGMTKFTFVSYYNALSSLILLPTSFLIHRSTRPPITFSLLCKFFLLAVFGCIANVTGNAAIEITPASFTSAILNLVPGFTFILAVIFRMEVVHYRSSSTQAKSIGTLVLIVGALVVTLYKGPSLLTKPSHRNISQRFRIQQETNLITGGVLLVIDCLASSAFTIAQGFIGSAAQVSIGIWCLKKRGPLFVAVFHPLGIIISAAVGILFLGDIMYLGSLVGSIIIVAGFYSVMWGKANERKVFEDEVSSLDESTSEEAPLLQKH
ncbi:WAT1-related protein At3g28050-like isoform X3 [Rhododendron vialii]|uniref:WAT1-related protein At3g28050-like isoform X3 n=1 Tax=Rhododendron vialii TaxID=182163 RepID=UPI00265E29B7|nr:WAT1-related protein At3g28050-like isoform X3 [Rhododendron vialii]